MADFTISVKRRSQFSKFNAKTVLLTVYLTCGVTVLCNEKTNYTVCGTENCEIVGNEICSQLYSESHICNNFYAFVCGGWHLNNPIPRGQLWRDQFQAARERSYTLVRDMLEADDQADDLPHLKAAREYHRACTNHQAIEDARVEPIKKILAQTGGWPITEPQNEYPGGRSWREIDSFYSKLRAASTFYELDTVVEDGRNILTLKTPTFMLPPEKLVAGDQTLAKGYYRNVIMHTVLKFTNLTITELYKAHLSTKISQLLDFEIELAKIVYNNNKNITSHVTTIGEFQKFYKGKLDLMVKGNTKYEGSCLLLLSRRLVPKQYEGIKRHKCQHEINWLSEIRHILDVEESEIVHMHTPLFLKNVQYYPKLCRLLERTPDEVIVNYINWSFVRSLLAFTDSKTKDILHTANKKLHLNFSEHNERWKQCAFTNAMIEIVYHKTLTRYFPDHVNNKGFDIYSAVELETRRKFMRSPESVGYYLFLGLDAYDHKQLRYKAPKLYLDLDRLTRVEVEDTSSKDYLNFVLSHKRLTAKKNIWRTLEPVDIDRDMNPWNSQIGGQVYETDENKTFIDYPAGSLQAPFFGIDLPEAYLFGTLGTQLGQKTSEIINLPVQRISCYADKAVDCLLNQKHGDYHEEKRKLVIHGKFNKTALANQRWSHKIQDLLGLDIAFKAYRRRVSSRGNENIRLPGLERYNGDQLFFIGYANAQCESPVTSKSSRYAPWFTTRGYSNGAMVNMAIMNNEAFGKVFNCPAGTPMNPHKKCKVWDK